MQPIRCCIPTFRHLTGGMDQDAIQVYLFETDGVKHLYAQPFSNQYALPGEHHAVLGGSMQGAAVLRNSFAGPRWHAGELPEVAQALNANDRLAAVVEQIVWSWRVGLGRVQIPWLVQLRPLGQGRTHLCLQATGEARSGAHQAGFEELARLRSALWLALQTTGDSAERAFLEPESFGALFQDVLAGAPLAVHSPPSTPPIDLSGLILAELRNHAGGKLHVGAIPPAKEANARRCVLPAALREQPILALVDLTILGSAKDAVVFLPAHCVLREGDERLRFAWPEVREVEEPATPEAREVVIHLSSVGELAIPCGGRARAMASLFRKFAALP